MSIGIECLAPSGGHAGGGHAEVPVGWGPGAPCGRNAWPRGRGSFLDACRAHDIGCSTCGKPKDQTDDEFQRNLRSAQNGLLLAGDPAGYAKCMALAQGYSTAVSVTLGPPSLTRGGPRGVPGEGTLLNRGTLRADVSGQTLRVSAKTYLDRGVAEAVNGGILAVP